MFSLTPAVFSPFNLFEREFDNFFNTPAVLPNGLFGTDISEKDDAYKLETDLPGFDKSEISVEYSDGVLTLSAEHSDKNENDGFIRRERRQGKIERRFSIDGIDENGITASFTNGVLTVNLPKLAPVIPETKKIEIA